MIEVCFQYLSVPCIRLYVLVMSHTRFSGNPHSIVARMSRNFLLEGDAKSQSEVTATELEPRTN